MLALIFCLLAQDWPQFRGPHGSGVAAGDAPVTFGAAKWKTPLPAGHSSPAVWGDRIFLTSFDKKLELICVSAKTGAILWRHFAPAIQIEETHVVSNPATASPAVDSERVYAYFSSYGVMAFDHSGEPKWTAPRPMPKTHHGSGASPILVGELLIINHDAMQGGYLLALDRKTGKEVWKQPYVGGRVESYSTALVARSADSASRGRDRKLPGIERCAAVVDAREYFGREYSGCVGRRYLREQLEQSGRGRSTSCAAGLRGDDQAV
jgi:hypothetical protein